VPAIKYRIHQEKNDRNPVRQKYAMQFLLRHYCRSVGRSLSLSVCLSVCLSPSPSPSPSLSLFILTAILSGEPRLASFIGAKDNGSGGDNWSYKTCKAPVKLSLPTNQHPTFTGRMPFLSPNQHCQSIEGRKHYCMSVITKLFFFSDSLKCCRQTIKSFQSRCKTY